MRHCLVLLALCLSGPSAPQASAQQAPAVFAHLAGVWQGEGTLFGQPARFEMAWRLEHGLGVLTFSNRLIGAPTPMLGSVAIYRTDPATPRATWEDTRGVRVEITWTATDSLLVATWTAPTESGRTEYELRSDGTVEVIDQVLQRGELVLFGQATYRRVR